MRGLDTSPVTQTSGAVLAKAEQHVFGRGERGPQMPYFGKGLSRSHGCDMGVKVVCIAKIGMLLWSLGCFPVTVCA